MSIVVDALAALGGLSITCCVLVVWWGIARHRKSERAAGDEMALVNAVTEPSDDAVAMVKDWKPAPPARPVLRNIPVGDGSFHADGLDEAIAQIMKEGH